MCVHRCGNNVRETVGSYSEQCDDGNFGNQDGCSSTCTVEDTHTCTGGSSSSPDVCTHKCGNGDLDVVGTYSESCDDGNL